MSSHQQRTTRARTSLDVMPTPFRTTLIRVMVIQLVALGLLWWLQSRYAA